MGSTVRDVMTASPRTLDTSASLVEAARTMRDADIGTVIVAKGDQLAGIVTDRDIVVRAIAEGCDLDTTSVADVASWEVETVRPDENAEQAVERMRRRNIRRVVVAEADRPIGILSIGDVAVDRQPDSALADISSARPNR
jgi:signal-transduction protein with cAMP-binding, CBS, and nucleotidyltransferase domain